MKKSRAVPKARTNSVKHRKATSVRKKSNSTSLSKRSGGYLRFSLKALNPKSKAFQALCVAVVFAFIGIATLLFSSAYTGYASCSSGCKAIAGSGTNGYWVVGADGGVHTFNTPFYGAATGATDPAGIATRPQGDGYWIAGKDGGVFTFGNAPYHGSLPEMGVTPNQPIVAILATPSGNGYMLIGADGGTYHFGDAPDNGSLPGYEYGTSSIVGGTYGPGGGYWLVESNGTRHDLFGGYARHSPDHSYNSPVSGIVRAGQNDGYWLVSQDGGVFSFGNAPFHGSMGGQQLNAPVLGMTSTPDGNGYWLIAYDGGVFSFGNAEFQGNPAATPPVAEAPAPAPAPVQAKPAPVAASANIVATAAAVAQVCNGDLRQRRTLTTGTKDVCVADLIRMLRVVMPGADIPDTDSYNGDLTNKVIAYQFSIDLPRDGVVGFKTWEALSQARVAKGLTPTSTPQQFSAAIEQKIAEATQTAQVSTSNASVPSGTAGNLGIPQGVTCAFNADSLVVTWWSVNGADAYRVIHGQGTVIHEVPQVSPFVTAFIPKSKLLAVQEPDLAIYPMRAGKRSNLGASLMVYRDAGKLSCTQTPITGEATSFQKVMKLQ